MAEQFCLFLRNFPRNCDIAEVLARPRERQDVGACIQPPVLAIEGSNPRVGQDREDDCPPRRAWCDSRQPSTETFRASGCATHLDHADPEAQTCPPFPVNDS